MDPEQKPIYKRLVPYATGCKDEEKCITDLKVNVALVNIRYVSENDVSYNIKEVIFFQKLKN